MSGLKHKEQLIIQRTWKGKWYYMCILFKLNIWSDMNWQWQYTKYSYKQHKRNMIKEIVTSDYFWWDVSKHVRSNQTVQRLNSYLTFHCAGIWLQWTCVLQFIPLFQLFMVSIQNQCSLSCVHLMTYGFAEYLCVEFCEKVGKNGKWNVSTDANSIWKCNSLLSMNFLMLLSF
jgi:hypothetical protein